MAFEENIDKLSKGGFQGVQKVRGILTDMVEEESQFLDAKTKLPKMQLKVTLTDAVVLRMTEGEEILELPDGKFTFWVSYATKGKVASQNSVWGRCWLASAKALGKTPAEFKGEYVTLEKIKTVLFKTDKAEDGKQIPLNPDGSKQYREVTTDKNFLFVKDEDDSEDFQSHLAELVEGKTEKVAARAVLLDSRISQHPEYKEAVKNGTLGALLGLKVVDGVYKAV